MFKNVTPESVGISSKFVKRFIESCERNEIVSHSILMMRGNNIFAEYYWKPFDRDKVHRMYSQTKSFVGIAIGLLESDGKLSLEDKIYTYFPEKIEKQLPENLKNQTIKDMLTMQTCGTAPYWFYHKEPDRTHLYFNENDAHIPSGMRWHYDSDGSQVLSVLVEKLSGMSLFDFLNKRIFKHIGAFKNATILKTKNDDSFGDSALLCTTRDMATFARLIMNNGMWNGKRLVSEDYIKLATSRIVDNHQSSFNDLFHSQGYGFQIWKTKYDGFGFIGMGNQLTICIPSKDFIFSCTSDDQGYGEARALKLSALYDLIVENLEEAPLPEDKTAFEELEKLGNNLQLAIMEGDTYSSFQEELSGTEYVCGENPMGISRFSIVFDKPDEGRLCYTNKQGEKTLFFGIGKNVFGKFPQLGYSDIHTCVPSQNPDFMYDCAVSVAWAEEKKFLLRVQIIDDYLGNMFGVFSFKGDIATVTMVKNAEAFLDEYNGEMVARKII